MWKLLIATAAAACLLATGGPALAQFDLAATLLGTGDDERVDGATGCAQEADFIVGVYNDVIQLRAGGNAWGCDSEWGAFAEFDFSAAGETAAVESATLRWRYTGYGDDVQGLPYLAVYGYPYPDGPLSIPRDDLDDQTALAIFAPTSVTNVDIVIDVTDYVAELVDHGVFQTGFLLCGVYSEVGYNELTYFGGAGHATPPRLDLVVNGTVPVEPAAWGAVKGLYR